MTTTLHLKANSRGSWTNVLTFRPHEQPAVEAACEGLVEASGRTVSFKITDDTGRTLAALDARQAPAKWATAPDRQMTTTAGNRRDVTEPAATEKAKTDLVGNPEMAPGSGTHQPPGRDTTMKLDFSQFRPDERHSNHAVQAFSTPACPISEACFGIATGFGGAITNRCEHLSDAAECHHPDAPPAP